MAEELDQIRQFYVEAFAWYSPAARVPPVHVTFYPYIGINHTIRVRAGEVYVRIAEICASMPAASHKGLAYILVGKLLNKKIPAGARKVYSAYVRSDTVRNAAVENKRSRGRKVITTSKGLFYDLDEMFEHLNKVYFAGSIPKPVLTWSARKTYRILGHHDSTHGHITISRSLDSADVPRYVVEYILFHGMLHIHHPTKHVNGRRYNHTAAFRRDEARFARYDDAERWIERNVRKLKREARRK